MLKGLSVSVRKAVSGAVCAGALLGGCTSQEDAEEWLNLLVAMVNGGLVDDYDGGPPKTIENRGGGDGGDTGSPAGASSGAASGSPGAGDT